MGENTFIIKMTSQLPGNLSACRCDACSSVWPSLYCMALNYPVRNTGAPEFKEKRRGYAIFMRSLIQLLPCESSRGALAQTAAGSALSGALDGGREAVCRFVHDAERRWRGARWNVELPDRCARYEGAARAGNEARVDQAPEEARNKRAGWFLRSHCSDQGMRSAVWGPPMWLLLYVLESSAVKRGGEPGVWDAWKDVWSEASMGRVLPCAICRKRYMQETFGEIIVPFFRAHPTKAVGGLVRTVHQAVRMKVTSSDLAPLAWVLHALRRSADMLSPFK